MSWAETWLCGSLAYRLKNLPQRHCFLKLANRPTEQFIFPEIEPYPLDPETVLSYEHDVNEHALPASEVDSLLRESERQFLSKAFKEKEVVGTGRPQRRKALLSK